MTVTCVTFLRTERQNSRDGSCGLVDARGLVCEMELFGLQEGLPNEVYTTEQGKHMDREEDASLCICL